MEQKRKKRKRKVFIKRMRKRLQVLLIVFTLFFVVIVGKIIYFNIVRGDDYNEKILSQKGYESVTVPYKRGDIYDCNGSLLATSTMVYNVIIEPKNILEFDSKKKATSKALKKYFNVSDEEMAKYLAKSDSQYEVIRKKPQHNMIIQGAAGSGKTTVAMHRISYILYNYDVEFKPEDFYVIGSNQVVQFRKNPLGRLVAAEIVESGVKGNEAGVACLDHGLGGRVRNAVEADPIGDKQVTDLGKYVSGRRQLDLRKNLPAEEKTQHAYDIRYQERNKNLAAHLVFPDQAVDDGADADDKKGNHHDHEHGVHDPVFLNKYHPPVDLPQLGGAVKKCAPADSLNGEENHGAHPRKKTSQPFRHSDAAQAEDCQHDEQLQEASADVGKPRGKQGGFGRFRLGLQKKAEIGHRNNAENQCQVHVVVLPPDQHVRAGQQRGKNKKDKIVGLHDPPPRSRVKNLEPPPGIIHLLLTFAYVFHYNCGESAPGGIHERRKNLKREPERCSVRTQPDIDGFEGGHEPGTVDSF